jgi:hypothetical protein
LLISPPFAFTALNFNLEQCYELRQMD